MADIRMLACEVNRKQQFAERKAHRQRHGFGRVITNTKPSQHIHENEMDNQIKSESYIPDSWFKTFATNTFNHFQDIFLFQEPGITFNYFQEEFLYQEPGITFNHFQDIFYTRNPV